MEGVQDPSHLQSFAGVRFEFWEKIAKNRKKSQNIDVSRIGQQRKIRFLKLEFSGSILLSLYINSTQPPSPEYI